MRTKVESLHKIELCLDDRPEHGSLLTVDHYLPKALVTRPYRFLPMGSNPFYSVVNSATNKFILCYAHHREVDAKKMRAFVGERAALDDPEELLQFLLHHYPITRDDQYRSKQLDAMVNTNEVFSNVAGNLNGVMPRQLEIRYHGAALVAEAFNRKLRKLRHQI